ncbi:MAG TPA: formate/nitrite transporter family protein [Symbiobacteriaceae bacterium]
MSDNNFDAYSPAEMAARVEQVGVVKANMPLFRMGTLGVLAGTFIAMGSVYFLTVTAETKTGFGIGQLLGGLVFSLGLILVVIGGAELFTGNNLIIMAVVSRKIPVSLLLRNWVIVFLGNFLGALSVAAICYWAQHWAAGGNVVGARALAVGVAKVTLPFWVAFWRAVLCNVLVCLAVWLCSAARTVTDKILAIIFPISAFVAAGFEHSVANMFFIPYAIWLKGQPAVTTAANLPPEKLAQLDWLGFVGNLVPVTLGNIVGGAVLVGLVYWICYLWDGQSWPFRRKTAA